MINVENFVKDIPSQTNLTEGKLFRDLEAIAQELKEDEISSLDSSLSESHLANYNSVLTVKLAKSKHAINTLTTNIHLTVVFAVYKETDRLSFPHENKLGEDCLNEKVRQLEWLSANSNKLTWDLLIIDDGCPDNSGSKALEIAEKSVHRDKIKVLHLQDAIQAKTNLTGGLKSTSESQKGGAILFGLRYAASLNRDNNIILYTDADLSSHLGMSGLLVQALLNDNKSLAIGSRREKTCYTMRTDFRNHRGKLFIYLRRRLLHPINYISDEQCGFKAFDAKFLDNFLEDVLETKFSFDVELLLRTELKKHNSIAQIPIAWYDSDEASTTKDIEPYVPMLNRMIDFYEHYLPTHLEAEDFKAFIKDLTDESWDNLIHNIPDAIKSWDPVEDIQFNDVSTSQLRKCASMD